MSELLEKRPDGASRRLERAKKERKEKRRVRVTAISVVAVLALLFAGAMFINSKLIRRMLPALTIGNVSFSAAEYDYYFISSLLELQNYYTSMLGAEGASDYLPSNDTALSSQIQNPDTGETWADYIATMAIQNMTGVAQFYDVAIANGFGLSSESSEDIEAQIASLKSQATMYSFPSFKRFLQQVYGSSMNESSLRKILQRSYISSTYSKHIYDSFTYSSNELAEYYSENADTFDNFIFRAFIVSAEPIEEADEDEQGDEADYDIDYDIDYDDMEYAQRQAELEAEREAQREAAREAAMEVALAEASEQAGLIVAEIESDTDFINAAKEYDALYYEDPDSTLREVLGSSLVYEVYGDWLKESTRKYGDITTVDTDTGTHIVFFIERDKNEYDTKSIRQILIRVDSIDPSAFEEGEEDPEYIEAVQNAEAAASERAQTVLTLFTEGGATEDKLIELMPEYSDDSTEGGLYEMIQKGGLGIPEIDDWLYAPDRTTGDYDLLKSDAYGYHLVFLSGYGKRSCDVTAENKMRDRDYQEWTESIEAVEPATHWAFTLTQRH